MIFLLMLALALLLMLPLFLSLRTGRQLRDRRETALTIHRAQLDELAKDLRDSRIDTQEYAGARLEIERRVLSADGLTESRQDGNARNLLVAAMFLIPVMAFLLYLPGSTPEIPSEPHGQWVARAGPASTGADADCGVARVTNDVRSELSQSKPGPGVPRGNAGERSG